MAKITVAVISDLHFCNERPEGSGSPLSRIVIQRLHETPHKNPWSDLLDLVKKERIQADYLLCPGDITTHAMHGPLKAAWQGLLDLGAAMGAKVTACATGNHDVFSRVPAGKGSVIDELDKPHDFFENLKLLSPEYPLQINDGSTDNKLRRQRRTEYFGSDFVVHEDEQCRIVIFNSCARHINDESVYERGIMAESALLELEEQLKSMVSEKINIFLCHHHPIVHSQDGVGTYDFIHRGDELIKRLQEHGDWIIIHGHKHQGRIVYATSGSTTGPVVFSASSLGAIFVEEQLNKYRNQFYILNIHLPDTGSTRGTAKIWNWHLGGGWLKSKDRRVGLVDGVGFGERGHPDTLAAQVAAYVHLEATPWEQVVEKFSFINYLTPDGLEDLLKALKKKHKIVAGRDESSQYITEIGPGA